MPFLRAAGAGDHPISDRPSDPVESGAYRTKSRVLLVDDDHSTARQLALALEVEGLETHTVVDGDQALVVLEQALAEERPVDLVIVELMLPRRSGLEVARDIRDRFPEVRIVLTGAYHLSERQLTRAGCNAIAFVPKPCEPDVVAAFVKEKALRFRTR